MTELERLLTAQFERMEQRHQDETRALREQLDAQQRCLESLQGQLQSTLSEYETHCASLHSTFVALEKSTRSEFDQHGAEFGPEQRGYRSSTWLIEQQCSRSQELAGELEQGAALIADMAAEQRRDRGLSM